MTDDWTSAFSGMSRLDPGVRQHLAHAGRIVRMAAGATVFGVGQAPENFVLVIEGDIRVSQVSESGREIVLYRVMPGEGCALTTACLIAGDHYMAEAVAETDLVLVALSRTVFDDLMMQSAPFRRFVMASFSQRLTDMFRLVDEVAFQRIDLRLAHKLLELAGDGDELAITHQQLASELGTAREVVSRHLHEMQRRGWLSAGRGSVKLVDRAALQRSALDPDTRMSG